MKDDNMFCFVGGEKRRLNSEVSNFSQETTTTVISSEESPQPSPNKEDHDNRHRFNLYEEGLNEVNGTPPAYIPRSLVPESAGSETHPKELYSLTSDSGSIRSREPFTPPVTSGSSAQEGHYESLDHDLIDTDNVNRYSVVTPNTLSPTVGTARIRDKPVHWKRQMSFPGIDSGSTKNMAPKVVRRNRTVSSSFPASQHEIDLLVPRVTETSEESDGHHLIQIPRGIQTKRPSTTTHGSSGYAAVTFGHFSAKKDARHQETINQTKNQPPITEPEVESGRIYQACKASDEIYKCYKGQKRLTIIMTFLNVLLIILVMLLLIAYLMFKPHNPPVYPTLDSTQTPELLPGPTEFPPHGDVPEAPEFMCMSCASFEQPVDQLDINIVEQDGLCCVKSLSDVIKSIKSMAAFEAKTRTQVFLQNVAYNNKNFTMSLPKVRSAIHLQSDSNTDLAKSWHRLIWGQAQADQLQGYTGLSGDRTSIRVPSNGYYFIYSRVHFAKTGPEVSGNFTLTAQLMVRRNGEDIYLDEVSQRCMLMEGAVEHSVHLENTRALRENDVISVRVSDGKFLDSSEGVHTFGLFEI